MIEDWLYNLDEEEQELRELDIPARVWSEAVKFSSKENNIQMVKDISSYIWDNHKETIRDIALDYAIDFTNNEEATSKLAGKLTAMFLTSGYIPAAVNLESILGNSLHILEEKYTLISNLTISLDTVNHGSNNTDMSSSSTDNSFYGGNSSGGNLQ